MTWNHLEVNIHIVAFEWILQHKITCFRVLKIESVILTQRRTTSPKFILVILVFLCLVHTKTKENQTNSEPQEFTSEPQNLMSSFEVVNSLFYVNLKSTLHDN